MFPFKCIFPCLFLLLSTSVGVGCKEKARVNKAKVSLKQISTKRKDTILLVGLSFNEPSLVRDIQNRLQAFYKQPSTYITMPLPAAAYYAPRQRYKAGRLLSYVSTFKGNHSFVIGLTSKDISTTKGDIPDYGIFGMGSLSNRGCVASIYRLKRNAYYSLLSQRLQKVVIHEVGHNHGLQHCTTPFPCIMKDANGKMSTVDKEPMDICAKCKKSMAL